VLYYSSDSVSFAACTFSDITSLLRLLGLDGNHIFSTTVTRKLTILLSKPRSTGVPHHLLRTSLPSGETISYCVPPKDIPDMLIFAWQRREGGSET
jgi:hypothetical protein